MRMSRIQVALADGEVPIPEGLASLLHRSEETARQRVTVEDPANGLRRQLRLRQESPRRAFRDEIREVRLRVGRDQDDRRPAAAVLLGQVPGKLEAVFLREPDVDKDQSRFELLRLAERLPAARATPTTDRPCRSRSTRAVSRNKRLSSTMTTRNAIAPVSQAARPDALQPAGAGEPGYPVALTASASSTEPIERSACSPLRHRLAPSPSARSPVLSRNRRCAVMAGLSGGQVDGDEPRCQHHDDDHGHDSQLPCGQCVRVRHGTVSPHRTCAPSGDAPGDDPQPRPGIQGTTTPVPPIQASQRIQAAFP